MSVASRLAARYTYKAVDSDKIAVNLSARSTLDPEHVPECTVLRIKRPKICDAGVCKQDDRFIMTSTNVPSQLGAEEESEHEERLWR